MEEIFKILDGLDIYEIEILFFIMGAFVTLVIVFGIIKIIVIQRDKKSHDDYYRSEENSEEDSDVKKEHKASLSVLLDLRTKIYSDKKNKFRDNLRYMKKEERLSYAEKSFIPNATTLGDALKEIMDKLNVTVEELEDRTGISQSTIKRYRKNEYTREGIVNIIAICIALHLLPVTSLYLLRLGGYSFKSTKEDEMYAHLLLTQYDLTVSEVNEILRDMNFKPLTGK